MKKVLIVDDEKSFTELLAQILNDNLTCPVESYNRPADALKAIQAGDVGVLVTDYYMPVMNGIEFIRKFRQHPAGRGVPIILLTTESDAELKREAREAGATGWITKPFQQEQLLAVMKKVAGA